MYKKYLRQKLQYSKGTQERNERQCWSSGGALAASVRKSYQIIAGAGITSFALLTCSQPFVRLSRADGTTGDCPRPHPPGRHFLLLYR